MWIAEPGIEMTYSSCVFVVAFGAANASDGIGFHLNLRLVVMTFACVDRLLLMCLNCLVLLWGILPCARIQICFRNGVDVSSLAFVLV